MGQTVDYVTRVGSTPRKTAWRRRAACLGTNTGDFYPENGGRVPTEILQLCLSCPVRTNCLTEALVFNEPGIWGGTNVRERALMRRRYRRNSCPSCGPAMIVPYGDRQACAGCGLSWIASKRRNNAGLVRLEAV